MTFPTARSISFSRRFLPVLAAGVILSACNFTTGATVGEGIGYREARFAEISAMRAYRDCVDEAVELDAQARKEGSAARYLASARLIEKCESELAAGPARAGEDERLRAYALGIQNFFKGGDVARAQENLAKLQKSIPAKDLMLADGSSFLDTMSVLLGKADRSSVGQFSVANVGTDLKSELRRVRYWKKN